MGPVPIGVDSEVTVRLVLTGHATESAWPCRGFSAGLGADRAPQLPTTKERRLAQRPPRTVAVALAHLPSETRYLEAVPDESSDARSRGT